METKKNPRVKLENYSIQFLLLGLVLTLYITYIAFEHKTYTKVAALPIVETVELIEKPFEEMVITHRRPPVLKKAPPPPPKMIEIIQIIKDDVEIPETIVETTETDEEEAVVTSEEIDAINEMTEYEAIVEDVPFAVIEEVPVFPGCEKLAKEEQKKCFSKKISKYVNRRFDIELANELGLSEGRKRIFVMFTINEYGRVADIKARAPHPSLQKEAARVIESLPKMKPGKQRNTPVRVTYSLPITFEVR